MGKTVETCVVRSFEGVYLSTVLPLLEDAIANATPEQCPAIVGELECLKVVAWAKAVMTGQPGQAGSTPPMPDHYLTVPEAVERFKVSATWLYRHKKQISHSQPSRKVLLFPASAIGKWFASRKRA